MPEAPDNVSREFRTLVGFTSQEKLKHFYKASDIEKPVNFEYIQELNSRLAEIVTKVNSVVHTSVRLSNISTFLEKNLHLPFSLILQNNLLPLMNNQGRNPENVYYNWMRGHLFSEYFKIAIGQIFQVPIDSILNVGEDDFTTIETFRRAATADLELEFNNKVIRLEMQSGFTGINDIKQHKWSEAVRRSETSVVTIVAHFDLFNGAAAFIRLDNIAKNDLRWVTRQQLEGQTVYSIASENFSWIITEQPPIFSALGIDL